jgi:hypothetical protein
MAPPELPTPEMPAMPPSLVPPVRVLALLAAQPLALLSALLRAAACAACARGLHKR